MLAGAVAAILMYHHVSAQPAGGPYGRALTATPAEFESQLRYLRARGCAAVGVTRLVGDVRRGRVRGCEVALTFDDGYADSATDAAPLLRAYGATATFFVTTRYIGRPGHLTRAMLRALAAGGMEIGAHTVSHPDLTLVASPGLEREIGRSRADLHAIVGQPVEAFAYPSGRYDRRVEDAVQRAGFAVAVTTDPGVVTPRGLAVDRFALPRYRMLRGRGESLLARVLALVPAPGAASGAAVRAIARERIAGNAPSVAERVAIALLDGGFPEQILKVRVYAAGSAVVAGIELSGVKFHAPVDRQTFAADAADMVDRAFAADAAVSEVDVWAVVPTAVAARAAVSGDMAVPTTRTVFSASLLRTDPAREQDGLGTTYWEPGFLQETMR